MKKLTVSVKSDHTGEMRTTLELSSDPARNRETVRLTVRRTGSQNVPAVTKKGRASVSPSSGSDFAPPEFNFYIGPVKKT